MKHQVLTCQGPPKHTWEREGGRGRPPLFCPEHDPKNQNQDRNGSKTDKPAPFKSAIDPKVNPFIAKYQRKQAETPRKPEPKPEPIPTQNRENEIAALAKNIELVAVQYDEALSKASAYKGDVHEMERLYNKASAVQNRYINMLTRMRILDPDNDALRHKGARVTRNGKGSADVTAKPLQTA